MKDSQQLNLVIQMPNSLRKQRIIHFKLYKIKELLGSNRLAGQVIDKTKSGRCEQPRKIPTWMIKSLFLQFLSNLGYSQLEDQLIALQNFKQFTGIKLDQQIHKSIPFCQSKVKLIKHNLHQRIFEEFNRQIEDLGLWVKNVVCVHSSNKSITAENVNMRD